jgi:capsular polysaccharide biosynthesis protein
MEEKKQEERVTNEHPAEAPRPAAPPTHASELPKHQVTAPTSTGNPKVDQRYQQQQEKLVAKQNQQHQKLQQQQEREDQRATQQNYQAQQHQQVEQRHQQQTTHMEQQHIQQTEHLQTQQGGHPGGRPQ